VGEFLKLDRLSQQVHVPLAAIMQLGLPWFSNFAGLIRKQMHPFVWRCSDAAFTWCYDTVRRLNRRNSNSGFMKIFQNDSMGTQGRDITKNTGEIDPAFAKNEEIKQRILWFIDLFYSHANSRVFSGIVDLDVQDDNLRGLTDLKNEVWQKSRAEGCIAVIPRLLNEPRFGMHHRLWILKAVQSPTGSAYRIVSKHIALGLEDINERPPSRVLERVRIISWEDQKPVQYK